MALPAKKVMLQRAAGLVLAEDIFALTTIPGFSQSSMDGYALSFKDLKAFKKLKIAGVLAAGNSDNKMLQPGTAVRIFTGAAVPTGADTVVMQEKTITDNAAIKTNTIGSLIFFCVKQNSAINTMAIMPTPSAIKLYQVSFICTCFFTW